VIGTTVRLLLEQTYPNFELLLLDDDSTDGTSDAALAASGCDPRLRVLKGRALPAGWLGKNWACQQLSQAAAGDYLIFTDADVRWSPQALAALAAMQQRTQADLLTVWPTQVTQTWAERLIVPLMALAVLGYLPLPLTHFTRWAAFAAANGQCMAFRRRAYDAVGGHAAVRDRIVEDVALSRRIKAAGLRLRMADGSGLIACRMYQGWPSVRDGFAKNILAGHGDSLIFLTFSTLFHLLAFVLPLLWLFIGTGTPGWPQWPLTLFVLGIGARALTAAATGQRVTDALLMPLSVLLMTLIAGRSVWWRLRGGPRWKDRTLISAQSPQHG
jgi:chlorobactene glucosyltransferase